MTGIKIVAGDGTGDYKCGNDAQVVINQALSWVAEHGGGQVHLKGPYEYKITGQIFIGSNTTLSGDSSAVITVEDNACGTNPDNCVFPNGKPVITQITGIVPENIEIHGFEINGNCQNQSNKLGYVGGKLQSAGSGVERLIGFYGSKTTKVRNINIHNMKFYDSFGEAVHIRYAEDVNICDNTASNHQHTAFFMVEVVGDNLIRNNSIEGITDGCIRLDNCTDFMIDSNELRPYDGNNNNGAMKFGQNGIQIANESNKYTNTSYIEVCNNLIEGPNICGIWLNDQLRTCGGESQIVRVHHNKFINCAWADWTFWSAGISVGPWGNGIRIDHNRFESCYNNAIQFTDTVTPECSVSVEYNNIINTMGSRTNSQSGPYVTGYGIINFVPDYANIIAIGNYQIGNKSGNYYNVNPSSVAVEENTDATIQPDEPSGKTTVVFTTIESRIEELKKYIKTKFTMYRRIKR